MSVTLVTREADLPAAIERLVSRTPRGRVAVDLESNGLFKYRACVCVVQLAAADDVVVVDSLAVPSKALAGLLGSLSIPKVVHDVAFDARLLAEEDAILMNVQDTSIAARMLGRTATGLASLLSSELGIDIDKKMQHHDWTLRPLDAAAVSYLAGDVAHLEALADRLFADVEAKGIAEEVAEETRYRLVQAAAARNTADPRPPWLRLKGIDKTPEDDLPILRVLAELREEKARALDVPPYKVIAPDVLFAIARAKPKTMGELDRIRGATQGKRARSLAGQVLKAVANAPEIPAEEQKMRERPRLPSSVAKKRRARADRLTKWRRAEATRREVDEQAILPGHVLQDLADLEDATMESIAEVPGIGAFRVARDGETILSALSATAETA